jgi:hypothetical protein
VPGGRRGGGNVRRGCPSSKLWANCGRRGVPTIRPRDLIIQGPLAKKVLEDFIAGRPVICKLTTAGRPQSATTLRQ